MVAAQVMGNDVAIGTAGASGHFELNVFKPVMIHNLLESVGLLADACDSFTRHCVIGIEPNRDAIARHVSNSLMLVTALNPVIGYDQAAQVAKLAYAQNLSLKEAVLRLGLLSGEEFDRHVRPDRMVHP
jgi:fumarate hydratase class II